MRRLQDCTDDVCDAIMEALEGGLARRDVRQRFEVSDKVWPGKVEARYPERYPAWRARAQRAGASAGGKKSKGSPRQGLRHGRAAAQPWVDLRARRRDADAFQEYRHLLRRETKDFSAEELKALREKLEHWVRTGAGLGFQGIA